MEESSSAAASHEDELDRLAREEIMKEAKRGAERAKKVGAYGWMRPSGTTNKRFLGNVLVSTLRSNRRKRKHSHDHDHRHSSGHRERRHRDDGYRFQNNRSPKLINGGHFRYSDQYNDQGKLSLNSENRGKDKNNQRHVSKKDDPEQCINGTNYKNKSKHSFDADESGQDIIQRSLRDPESERDREKKSEKRSGENKKNFVDKHDKAQKKCCKCDSDNSQISHADNNFYQKGKKSKGNEQCESDAHVTKLGCDSCDFYNHKHRKSKESKIIKYTCKSKKDSEDFGDPLFASGSDLVGEKDRKHEEELKKSRLGRESNLNDKSDPKEIISISENQEDKIFDIMGDYVIDKQQRRKSKSKEKKSHKSKHKKHHKHKCKQKE